MQPHRSRLPRGARPGRPEVEPFVSVRRQGSARPIPIGFGGKAMTVAINAIKLAMAGRCVEVRRLRPPDTS